MLSLIIGKRYGNYHRFMSIAIIYEIQILKGFKNFEISSLIQF